MTERLIRTSPRFAKTANPLKLGDSFEVHLTKASGGGQKVLMLPTDVDPAAVATVIRRRIVKAAPAGEPVVRLGRRAFVAVSWLQRLGGGDFEKGRRVLNDIVAENRATAACLPR